MTWVERKVIDYKIENLPFDDEEKLALIDPSRVRIEVPGIVYPADIGACCYTKKKRRSNSTDSKNYSIIEVKVNSFRSQRREFIIGYLGCLYHRVRIGRAEYSISSDVSCFISFVKWTDTNKPNGLDNKENIRETVSEFSEQLMHRVKVNELNINTASMYQKDIMSTCLHIYGDETGSLFGGIRIIRKSSLATIVTEPPSEENAAKCISVYNAIFNQLTDFVVNQELYPVLLSLPIGNYSVFPRKNPFFKQGEYKKDKNLQGKNFVYNVEECRLNTESEILAKINQDHPSKNTVKSDLRTATDLIAQVNRDPFHKKRILLATLASQAFMMMFSANTAMSLGLIADIKWGNDDFTTAKDVQGFRTIKYRAGNKEVSFMVGTSFVRFLTKYLTLRRYLMDAHNSSNYKYLFFRIIKGELKPLGMNAGYYFNNRLQNLFGMAKADLIGIRQWRSYKSNWLLENTDLTTTAMVLQNAETTVLKHYAEGSNKNAGIELTNFFEKFKESTVIGEEIPSSSISIGQCKSQGNPILNAEKIPFEPDCKKPEGCFFCQHYAVHADEEDLRKLLSFNYVIEQTRALAASDKHFSDLFGEVLRKIEIVTLAIMETQKISSDICDRIRIEVFEHEQLSSYWLRKLEMLIDMELI